MELLKKIYKSQITRFFRIILKYFHFNPLFKFLLTGALQQANTSLIQQAHSTRTTNINLIKEIDAN